MAPQAERAPGPPSRDRRLSSLTAPLRECSATCVTEPAGCASTCRGRPTLAGRPRRQRPVRLYNSCYDGVVSSSLAEVARRADDLVARGRAELVRAVRQAAAAGQTQAQIAAAIGRSQPEVSRLLHFHGTSPVARRLRTHAPEIKRVVADAGGSNVRVFGSVATGEDREGSDIDLLFTMGRPLSLMQLGALELAVSEIVGSPVDLVPDTVIRPEFRERVLTEAVPL